MACRGEQLMLKALEKFFHVLAARSSRFGRVWAALADWCEERRWWYSIYRRRDVLSDVLHNALANVQESRTALSRSGEKGDGIAHDVVIEPTVMLRDMGDYHDPEATLPRRGKR